MNWSGPVFDLGKTFQQHKEEGDALASMKRVDGLERDNRVKQGVRMLNDDFAGLKEYFQGDLTVIMPLNMFGAKLLKRCHYLWKKCSLVPERDHEQGVGSMAGYGVGGRYGPCHPAASHA